MASFDWGIFWGAVAAVAAVVGVWVTYLQFARSKDDKQKPTANAGSTSIAEVHHHHYVEAVAGRVQASERETQNEGRKVSIAKLPVTGAEVFGRDDELARLDDAWEDNGTNVLSLVAFGGVGKSALVNAWLARIQQNDWREAERVFGWSFYSQGTREAGTASGDDFVDQALRWFGDPAQEGESPFQRGERLARAVQRNRTLLVLDGLEPLQAPPGPDGGRVRDPAVSSLIRELAAENPGLCLVSTRVAIDDVAHFAATTAPTMNVEHLSDEAGERVLVSLGVTGEESELRAAAHEVGGHSLALNLLGTYLRKACKGDIRRRSEVPLIKADARQGGHAKRVMEAYEAWFGDGPEQQVLNLVGLFDRPARAELVDMLRGKPAVDALSNHLVNLTEDRWNEALSTLRDVRLLLEEDETDPGTLDAHPLVREHFGQRLEETHPKAFAAGHGRLFDYLKDTTKEFPDTLDEMAPLYQAVAHGCAAGRHQDALAGC